MSTARQLVADPARPPARSPELTRDSRRAHIRDREPRCTRTARSIVTGGGGDARALAAYSSKGHWQWQVVNVRITSRILKNSVFPNFQS
jgi:hypothetical protein